MKFGKSYSEVLEEPSGGGAGGTWIKYPGPGSTTLRILDEPSSWDSWWEHFDISQSKAFPCTNERSTCPGCTSDNQRTKKASRKVGFNAVSEYEGDVYVDYWKVTRKVADRLSLRATKDGTIRARDYILTRTGEGLQTDYDVDSEDKNVIDLSEYDAQRQTSQAMLEAAFDEVFGAGASAALDEGKVPSVKAQEPAASVVSEKKSGLFGAPASSEATGSTAETTREDEVEAMRRKIREMEADKVKSDAPAGSARAQSGDPEDPPTEPEAENDPEAEGVEEEPVLTMEDLRAMTKGQLVSLVISEQKAERLPEKSVSNSTKTEIIEFIVSGSE